MTVTSPRKDWSEHTPSTLNSLEINSTGEEPELVSLEKFWVWSVFSYLNGQGRGVVHPVSSSLGLAAAAV